MNWKNFENLSIICQSYYQNQGVSETQCNFIC